MRKYSWGEKICTDLASQFEHWFLMAYPTIPIALGIWWNRFSGVGRVAINCCAVRTDFQKKYSIGEELFQQYLKWKVKLNLALFPSEGRIRKWWDCQVAKKETATQPNFSSADLWRSLSTGRKYSQLLTISILPYIHACMRRQQGYVRQSKNSYFKRKGRPPRKKHPFFWAKQNQLTFGA